MLRNTNKSAAEKENSPPTGSSLAAVTHSHMLRSSEDAVTAALRDKGREEDDTRAAGRGGRW